MSIDLSNLRVEIGQRIRAVLDHHRVTQAEAARATGVSSPFLSQVLSGQSYPSVVLLHGLRASYGVSLDWIVTGGGQMWAQDVEAGVGRASVRNERTPPEIAMLQAIISRGDQQVIARVRGFLEGVEAAGGRPLALKKRA